MRLTPTARAAAILALLALAVSCTGPEKEIVDTFLTAVRDGQEKVVRAVSLVDLPDADVQSWEIVEVGPESTEPYRYEELRQAYFDANEAWESKNDDNDQFLNADVDKSLRYREKMKTDPDYQFTGAMAEYQKEWEARDAEAKELGQKVVKADEALKKEKDAIYMSANMAVKDSFEGDVSVKNVRVNVNGDSGSKTYTLTLRKYNVVDSETGITPMSRWIVTEVEG